MIYAPIYKRPYISINIYISIQPHEHNPYVLKTLKKYNPFNCAPLKG